MALGRPKVALILTDDERARLVGASVSDGSAPRAAGANHFGVRGGTG
jgi:hypothetical protein